MNRDDELEAALGRAMTRGPDNDEQIAGRVLARLGSAPLPPQKRGLLAEWWPAALLDRNFAPAWPRIAALACAAALGITVGISNLGTRIATDLDLVRVAAIDDGNTSIFDSDTVTGLRP